MSQTFVNNALINLAIGSLFKFKTFFIVMDALIYLSILDISCECK